VELAAGVPGARSRLADRLGERGELLLAGLVGGPAAPPPGSCARQPPVAPSVADLDVVLAEPGRRRDDVDSHCGGKRCWIVAQAATNSGQPVNVRSMTNRDNIGTAAVNATVRRSCAPIIVLLNNAR
jgi:hypothetical protein